MSKANWACSCFALPCQSSLEQRKGSSRPVVCDAEVGLGVVQGERAAPPFPACQDLPLHASTCWSRVWVEGALEACRALVPTLMCSHRLLKEDRQQGLTAPTFFCFIPSFSFRGVFAAKSRGRQCFYVPLKCHNVST